MCELCEEVGVRPVTGDLTSLSFPLSQDAGSAAPTAGQCLTPAGNRTTATLLGQPRQQSHKQGWPHRLYCRPVAPHLAVGCNLSCELADQYCISLLVTCPVNCWPVVHLAVGYNLYSELLVRGALLFKTHRNNLCNCMFVCFVDCWQIFHNICMWIEGVCHCCPNDRLFLPFTELIYFTTKTLCKLTWVEECQLVINSVCVVGKSS